MGQASATLVNAENGLKGAFGEDEAHASGSAERGRQASF